MAVTLEKLSIIRNHLENSWIGFFITSPNAVYVRDRNST